MFSAAEAAAQLNTEGKTLRRFLRQDALYKNAGSGGRYIFTQDDMEQLAERFNAWRDRPKSSGKNTTLITDEPGLSYSEARTNPAAVKAITEARVDRLEAALRASGLHISQMRERETWRTQAQDTLASA